MPGSNDTIPTIDPYLATVRVIRYLGTARPPLRVAVLASIADDPYDCWSWPRRLEKGYAILGEVRVHRLLWGVGHDCAVPLGYHVHHVCRARDCICPWHATAVTPGQHAEIHSLYTRFAPEVMMERERTATLARTAHDRSW